MSDNNFINSVKFNEDFAPFKGGDEIVFGGEKEMQDLLEFYLKDKEIESLEGELISPKDNAKRFKINCVLGNNGGGKSRLFEGLIQKNEDVLINNIEGKEILLDDFFVGSSSLKQSSNLEDLNSYVQSSTRGRYMGNNKMASKLFFLTKKGIDIHERFFGSNFSDEIDYVFKRTRNNEYQIIISDKIFKIGESIKTVSVLENQYRSGSLGVETVLKNFLKYYKENDVITTEDKLLVTIIHYLSKIKIRNNIVNSDANEFFNDGYNYDSIFIVENDTNILKVLEKLSLIMPIDSNLNEFIKFMDYFLWSFSLKFNLPSGKQMDYDELSAGQKMILLRLLNSYTDIMRSYKNVGLTKEVLILIDEPDLHLHLEWQKKYIQKLIDTFSTLPKGIKLHFILATHSPFIISDLPTESIIVLDGSNVNKYQGKFTEIINDYEKKYGRKTFGANYIDIIRDGFFFEDKVLMGSLAENVIGNIAQRRREEITEENMKIEGIERENIHMIEQKIGDDFLKSNLLYFEKGKK